MKRLSSVAALIVGFCLLTPAASAGIVITEVMFHPASDDSREEFLELQNVGASPVDVSDWCFEGIDFCFPPATPPVAAGAFVLLAKDATVFQATYGLPADFEYDSILDTNLDDNGEPLILRDAGQGIQDSVTYSDGPPWPVTPDGLGDSLELIDPAFDNDDPRNWHASSVTGGTPGAANSVAAVGLPPWISGIQHDVDPVSSTPIEVRATIVDATAVQFFYKIGFGTETSAPMLDDGNPPDAVAADGVYTAAIPGQPAGTLVRYRIATTGTSGTMDYPRDDDTVTYDGTVVADPTVGTVLPVIQWFMDPSDYVQATTVHPETDETEPAVIYFEGRLYDGVEARLRGQSSRNWPKPPWKFFFPQGHKFSAPTLLDNPVDTFDLQSNYSDKSYSREILAWESFEETGAPWVRVFSIHVRRNGSFMGLYNFLEAPEADWLQRMGLPSTLSRYKAFDDLSDHTFISEIEALYEKENRLQEDYTDLYDFTQDLNTLTAQSLENFLFDNVDIPTMVNYMAVQNVIHNNDHIKKNYYIWRDTEGTGRWALHGWDLDLTFGRNFIPTGVLNDVIWADVDVYQGNTQIGPSHPLFGTSDHRKVGGFWNRLFDRLLDNDRIRAMYFRRLRSVMDLLLAEGKLESRIDEIKADIGPDAAMDVMAWGQYGQSQDLDTATDILKHQYLDQRRVHLYTTHAVCDIPGPQPAVPPMIISEIMYNPSTGVDDEWVELYNPSVSDAVDLSGWRLDGVGLNIPAGTVVLPHDYVVFARNDSRFRTVHGSGKYVAAQYGGSLGDFGETLVLRNRFGGVVDAVTYDEAAPWPTAANGGGKSLELIDPTQDNSRVVNWAASQPAGGTPGAPNSMAGTISPVPRLYVNEILPDNATINSDEMGEFDAWIEIYNPTGSTVDLGGMYLSNDLGVPNAWPIPASTPLCAGCWTIVWADGQTGQGPLHTSFTLGVAGGEVGLFTAGGTLVDYLTYPVLPTDYSFGRFEDGGADQRVFSLVTPAASNDVPSTPMILNEYNACAPNNFLDNANSDVYWGRVQGNGGDWFELVVTGDHVDARGWELVLSDDTGGAGETVQSLFLTSDPVWSDLRAGTIITVSEDLPDDVSFDPGNGDWWINVRASSSGSGVYITAQDFEVSNDAWQLTIKDDQGFTVFGPAGEGILPVSGIGSDEVFKLEEDPTPYITPVDEYNDGTSSTFGAPNLFAGSTREQDFSGLWDVGLVGACTVPDMDGDTICDQVDNCPAISNVSQANADGDASGDACDACPLDPDDDADQDGICGEVDNCPLVTNAGQADGDTDGIGDICDNCAGASNPTQADVDGDGLGDACDPCPADFQNDADADGVCYSVDNCPTIANAGQTDSDGDGAGDPCDPCAFDALDDLDVDGTCGDVDNCPLTPNADQADGDLDGQGDLCDNCPADANAGQEDTDGDGLGDACDGDDDADGIDDGSDNCPFVANPGQADANLDGEGDACDDDDDGDGVLDASDNCGTVDNVAQTDTDGDGYGDACDCAVTDASTSQIPAEPVGTLRLSGGGTTTLTWSKSPQGHVSNVYRGSFSPGVAWAYDESCLAAAVTVGQAGDATQPASGSGYYYLVSGANMCGEGSVGTNSMTGDYGPFSACAAGPADGDLDGVDDDRDNCSSVANAGQADADKDFFGDACDNCPATTNPDQADLNGDGEGDVCDPDDEGDGVADGGDNCPTVANANQADADGDGLGNVCDPCTDLDGDGLGDSGFPANTCPIDPYPTDPVNDADGDGYGAATDNCSSVYNPSQIDTDGDGWGDACDICPFDPLNDADQDAVCAGGCTVIDLQAIEFDDPTGTVLVEGGDAMTYKPNTFDPGLGTSWVDPAFDDSMWPVGVYGTGYEAASGAENLIASPVPPGTGSIYTRTTFDIADVAAVNDLWFGADYDDGYVVWVNGVEVLRSPEMPTDPLTWNTSPTLHESSNGTTPNYGTLVDISSAGLPALVNGTNVLAVAVWNRQQMPYSSDLVLVPTLVMNLVPTMSYLANSSDPGIGMAWTAQGYDMSSWTRGNYGIGYETDSPGAGSLIQTFVPSGTSSIYTRTTFTLFDAAIVDTMLIGADYDDGYAAWINGVEIYRSPELTTGTLDWNTPTVGIHESSNGQEPVFDPLIDVSNVAVPALVNGINELAVAVWNRNSTSSDLVLVPSLQVNGIGTDNCPYVANPSQDDTDLDGVGDACDNCPFVFNPVQTDTDGDGLGNACDLG